MISLYHVLGYVQAWVFGLAHGMEQQVTMAALLLVALTVFPCWCCWSAWLPRCACEGFMIQLQNVTKLYGTVIGVNDITLSLKPGAYGLVGPNGSGKTTLLNLITGQLRPTIGQVNVLGASPWRQDGLLRAIGLCPAVDVFYPNVTAFEWVSYLVELYGFHRHEARQRAEDALHRVGMGDALHRAHGHLFAGDAAAVEAGTGFRTRSQPVDPR